MGSFINYVTQLGGRGSTLVLRYDEYGKKNGLLSVTEGVRGSNYVQNGVT